MDGQQAFDAAHLAVGDADRDECAAPADGFGESRRFFLVDAGAPIRAPMSPPVATPAAVPTAIAASQPAATTGPKPGIASRPRPASSPTPPPTTPPMPAPAAVSETASAVSYSALTFLFAIKLTSDEGIPAFSMASTAARACAQLS